jgi:outer membrane protein assembly factor BamA
MPLPRPAPLSRLVALAALVAGLLAGEVRASPAESDAPQGASCPDATAREVVLVGCAPEDCKAHAPIREILEQALSRPMTAGALEVASRRLIASRLVTRASLGCEAASGRLTADVTPQAFIRHVAIRGNVAFRKRELLKRVFLRAGTPLDPDATPDPSAPPPDSALGRQLESLARLYRQAGLEGASIRVELTRVSPTELDLAFVIAEGPPERVGLVRAIHTHARGDDSPCPRISSARLTRLLELQPGDLLTPTTERQVRSRLRRQFQAFGYERPEMAFTLGPPDANLGRAVEVTVRTSHCWLIRLWSRDAASSATADTLAFRWQDPAGLADPPPLLRGEAPYKREELATWGGTLPFAESGAFDRAEATRALDALTRELRARGFPFGEVRLVHRELPPLRDVSLSDVKGVIDYVIDRGLQRRIRALRLEGVRALSEASVRARLTTKPWDFFGGEGRFDEARVLGDLAGLERAYVDAGYFGLRFPDGGPDAEAPFERAVIGGLGGLRVWRYQAGRLGFRVEMAPHARDLDVILRLDEGRPLRVAGVNVEGFAALGEVEVRALVGLAPDDILAPARLDDAIARLTRRYRALGHVQFELAVRCRAVDASGAGASGDEVDCRDPSLARAERAGITVRAREGAPFRVGAVVSRGAHRTDAHVLTRDLPREGELLDLDRVQAAIRLMRTLPIFNAVKVDMVGLDAQPAALSGAEASPTASRTADLVVAVEEADTRVLDLAAGVRSIQRANIGRIPRWAANTTGLLVDQADRLRYGFGTPEALDLPDILLTVELEYADLNVDGDGEQLRLPFIAGFSLSEFLRLATFNPSYTWRRFLDTRMTLTARGLAELDRVTDPLDRLEFGAEADLLLPSGGRSLVGLNTRASVIRLAVPGAACVDCLTGPPLLAGSASAQELAEESADATLCELDPTAPGCRDGGFRPQLSVGLRWRHDTLDTPLHPTRGFMLSATTSFILDRDRFALAPTFNQFVKWEASIRGVLPLGPTILAAFLRYGGSLTFSQEFLPPDERYTLGGFNGLRGFSDNGICRYEADGSLEADCPGEFGGNVVVHGSLELRAPLLRKAGLWLGLFTDFGTLARSHDALRPSGVRASGGLGLRWLLGNLIPVRVDLGFPLFERRCVSRDAAGDCVLEEPSAFHVDLLYPF